MEENRSILLAILSPKNHKKAIIHIKISRLFRWQMQFRRSSIFWMIFLWSERRQIYCTDTVFGNAREPFPTVIMILKPWAQSGDEFRHLRGISESGLGSDKELWGGAFECNENLEEGPSKMEGSIAIIGFPQWGGFNAQREGVHLDSRAAFRRGMNLKENLNKFLNIFFWESFIIHLQENGEKGRKRDSRGEGGGLLPC